MEERDRHGAPEGRAGFFPALLKGKTLPSCSAWRVNKQLDQASPVTWGGCGWPDTAVCPGTVVKARKDQLRFTGPSAGAGAASTLLVCGDERPLEWREAQRGT